MHAATQFRSALARSATEVSKFVCLFRDAMRFQTPKRDFHHNAKNAVHGEVGGCAANRVKALSSRTRQMKEKPA
jgi:hypothetical protein